MIPLGIKRVILLLDVFWTGVALSISKNNKAEAMNLKMLNETVNQSLMNGILILVFINDRLISQNRILRI